MQNGDSLLQVQNMWFWECQNNATCQDWQTLASNPRNELAHFHGNMKIMTITKILVQVCCHRYVSMLSCILTCRHRWMHYLSLLQWGTMSEFWWRIQMCLWRRLDRRKLWWRWANYIWFLFDCVDVAAWYCFNFICPQATSNFNGERYERGMCYKNMSNADLILLEELKERS